MNSNNTNSGRRQFLVSATVAMGAAGVTAIATPLVSSMLPSAKTKSAGAPVEVDISSLEPGMMITQEWRGQPIWIVYRTAQMMEQLSKNTQFLADPDSNSSEQPAYCKNTSRSMSSHPEILVVVGICTHLGCSPVSKTKVGAADGMSSDWPGGFFCPCHGSKYDMSARVFKAVPAPFNMRIPPYKYLANKKILIGDDQGEA